MSHTFVQELFELEGFAHHEIFAGCKYPWEALVRLEQYLQSQSLGKIEGDVSASAYLVHPEKISLGKGVVVEPGAYIEGPCIIGAGTVIRHGAYLRGHVIVGEGCIIGHCTELKNAIFLNGASAAHFNYVADSVVGNRVNLGAGSKCANLRLDRRNIRVKVQGALIDTQMKKLGAIIGDGAQIGCNCVLNPGTVLKKNSICLPCLNIGGQ